MCKGIKFPAYTFGIDLNICYLSEGAKCWLKEIFHLLQCMNFYFQPLKLWVKSATCIPAQSPVLIYTFVAERGFLNPRYSCLHCISSAALIDHWHLSFLSGFSSRRRTCAPASGSKLVVLDCKYRHILFHIFMRKIAIGWKSHTSVRSTFSGYNTYLESRRSHCARAVFSARVQFMDVEWY